MIPAIATPPCGNAVTPDPTFNFTPSNVRFASSSNSPAEPAMTTLLSVKSLTFAVSATNASMFAVPSMNRSWNSLELDPRSLAPSSSGNISPPV